MSLVNMRIQTFSVVAGTKACNASCPFCISRMTGFKQAERLTPINERNFEKAVILAERSGVATMLITGKGEPTLYPEQITEYLNLTNNRFPLIELQTNAVNIGKAIDKEYRDSKAGELLRALRSWHYRGLDTISISVVSIHSAHNRQVYTNDYPDLKTTVRFLHDQGFSVRLCVMMQEPYIHQPHQLVEVIEWCKNNEVEQLTVRSIRKPVNTSDSECSDYVSEFGLSDDQISVLYKHVEDNGTLLMSLMHGAAVYDYDGQNVCLTDCLTTGDNEIRTLIFYSNGRIAYDWQYNGAVLIGGN